MSFHPQPEITALRGPVPFLQLILSHFIHSGDQVIDATCGNGYDTQLLAGLVGPGGRVWGFDIQHQALAATRARLVEADCSAWVQLIHAGHETIAAHCPDPVSAVVFNLGYLPGGDRDVITQPESTLAGLEQSLELLAAGGIVAITVYPGHAGGAQEQAVLEERATRLPCKHFHVWRLGQMNVTAAAPYSILIQRTL